MDYDAEYKIALELASTSRYKDAREKLQAILSKKPDHINALILLGKVEYYLRLFSSSRKRFETVLTYNPDNIAAYFGLEYFKEKKRHILFWTAFVFIIMLTVFLFFFGAFVNRNLLHMEKNISQKIDTFVSSTEAYKKEILINLNTLTDQHKQAAELSNTGQKKINTEIAAVNRMLHELKSRQMNILTDNNILISTLGKEIEELKKDMKRFSGSLNNK